MKKILFLLITLVYGQCALAALPSKVGILLIQYGDEIHGKHYVKYQLQTATQLIEFDMSEAFLAKNPIYQWHGQTVKVSFASTLKYATTKKAQAIELLSGKHEAKASVSGNHPWVSILCKFSDKNDEPNNRAYFQNMYANQFGGLDHYWRKVSNNNINIAGSIAVDWVDLPFTHSHYVPNPGNGTDADLNELFNDCTTAADQLVNFSNAGNGQPFAGINMMFNDLLDCCAWGGGIQATLDGTQKVWRVTWEPPWSYSNETVIAHEMGHGFGLPHANNSDLDNNPYDNPWDVMSANYQHNVTHPIYGILGQHINMFFKYYLGWVDDNDGFVASPTVNQSIIIDRTNIAVTNHRRFARIPLANGQQYFIESRKKVGDYEADLAGNAVIIHHVDSMRNEPPWVVDGDNPPANFSDNEGSMWKVGETFVDPIEGYTVKVLANTAEGFRVAIKGPQAPDNDLRFSDSFE